MPVYRRRSGAWLPSDTVVVDPVDPGTTVDAPPTGAGYVSYATLRARAVAAGKSDPDLQDCVDQLTETATVTFPPGVFETRRVWGKAPFFAGAQNPVRQAALLWPKNCTGVWGSGRGSLGSTSGTVIRVTPLTCQSASEGGSWMQSGGSGSQGFFMKNIHIEGTEQGNQTQRILDANGNQLPGGDGVSRKLFTNYFANNHGGQFIAEDVLSNGAYGNNGAPPGETFCFQVYGCDNAILRRVECDGRRTVGGPSFASVGITQGNSYNAQWYDCYAHHVNAKTYHMVFFQTAACKTYNCRLGDPSDLDGYGDFGVTNPSPSNPGFTGGGFNQERAMDSEHYGMFIYNNRKGPNNPDKGVHFNQSSDNWSRTFNGTTWTVADHQKCLIQDCSWFNHWGKAGNPLYVSTWIPYGGATNAINISPDVVNNGVHQIIMWSAGTSPIARQSPWNLTTGTTSTGNAPAPTGTGTVWLSGAGDDQTSNIVGGGFGTFRGEAATYARAWADASLAEMTGLYMVDAYRTANWNGVLDIAVGGPRDGITWASAAAGGMDATWRSQCQTLNTNWWSNCKGLHLSMAHELNNGYPWKLSSANVAAFKTAWQRWYGIVNTELKAKGRNVKVVLSWNSDTNTDLTVPQMDPGAAYYDIVGVDFYNMHINGSGAADGLNTQAAWDANLMLMKGASPRGIGAWFAYAESLGKPLSIPEWGPSPQVTVEAPLFVTNMRGLFASKAPADPYNPSAGKCAGDAYFNIWDQCRLYPTTNLPNTRAAYVAAKWGAV